jgi:hypothetical protein
MSNWGVPNLSMSTTPDWPAIDTFTLPSSPSTGIAGCPICVVRIARGFAEAPCSREFDLGLLVTDCVSPRNFAIALPLQLKAPT